MNLRKLPKDKRNKLFLVVLVTLMVIAGLYFSLIRRQHESLANLTQQKAAAADKLQRVVETIRNADQIAVELKEAKASLEAAEVDVASGDLYAWIINSLRNFNAAPYKVNIPQFSQLGPPVDVDLLPNFPYKQATLTVAGTARYHNLGQFLADFENQFPHVRLCNLSLDATVPSLTAEPESLSFKLDIVTLVKLNQS
jgi:Tfp pilus assembly protein PilO